MEWRIPLSDIDFGREEADAVQQVVQSRWLTMGAVTQTFEKQFAAYVGAKHAIAVTNATAALHLACLVAGLGPGDEVIVPSFTFVATANAVRYTGATVIFGDIENENWLKLSTESMEACLTPRRLPKLLIHYVGNPATLPPHMTVARKHAASESRT